ncbi:MAG: hypothetical protein K2O65_05955 [Lachnospiraceae bacterium]|nr:hypothetical protein [Lachnospiraceae bacterium]
MINEVLNKDAAVELFEREAILMGENNVVPFYRAVELFGEEAAIFFDRNMGYGNYLKFGGDYSGWGACSIERPFTSYLYKAGFLKLVTEHNYLRIIKAHKESEAGNILDRYEEERSRRIDERDAEEERKRAERKAKRAAAKAAREAAKKEQEEQLS